MNSSLIQMNRDSLIRENASIWYYVFFINILNGFLPTLISQFEKDLGLKKLQCIDLTFSLFMYYGYKIQYHS